MDKTFNPHVHTFASVDTEAGGDNFHIVHCTKNRVWLMIFHSDRLKVAHENVADGMSDGYDEDGFHIVSILMTLCNGFCDAAEALSIEAMRDIDEEIRSYAR